ncbi:MAG: DUF5698 domain-containing protein [Syntrophaceticus schinkii]|jgi:uncharacterized protein YebE (UPF0316 family)|nr:DUF5698 domain-containing protein [Syntrophaceticus schinkii]
MTSLWLGWFLIFFARVADMSMATVRTLFLVRGRPWEAGAIGFFEALLYIVALNQVFQNLNSIGSFFFYAAGFACGNIIGAFLEEKIAVGYIIAQIIPKEYPAHIVDKLREAGFGVTVWEAEGIEGKHQVVNVVIKRRDRDLLFSLVNQSEDSPFISISDARGKYGGVFCHRKDK